MSNITFTMIKPDAVADGHIGAILGKISEAGFKIKAMKLTQLTVADAKKFYEAVRKIWSLNKFPEEHFLAWG